MMKMYRIILFVLIASLLQLVAIRAIAAKEFKDDPFIRPTNFEALIQSDEENAAKKKKKSSSQVE